MTDRHSGFIVVLDKDIREDDAQPIISAIRQIKGVMDVQPIVSDPLLHIASIRVKNDILEKIMELLRH